MVERYVIYGLGKGYFTGINEDTNKPEFQLEDGENYTLFRSEGEAWIGLESLQFGCEDKSVTGKYRIEKLIFVS